VDMEESAIDEDLELLRADWATTLSAAAGSRRGGGCPNPFAATHCGGPVSELNRRGDLAATRLQKLQDLKQMAGYDCVNSHPALLQRRTFNACPGQAMHDANAVRNGCSVTGSKLEWRGPLDNKDEDIHERGELLYLSDGRKGIRRGSENQQGLRSAAQPTAADFSNDPWHAWESRWAEAFRSFEEAARVRKLSSRLAAEAERARHYEEHDHIRSEDVRRQQTRAPISTQEHRSGPAYAGSPKKPKRTPLPRSPQAPKPSEGNNVATFASFAAFEEAWSKFEAKVKVGGVLSFTDIPWPLALPSVAGVVVGDSAAERKKKLRSALLRWHPDKWAPILDLVREGDKGRVMESVKTMTLRILAERDRS